ncbi:MAG: matrixin family metalloprotease [Minisyncoccia bacterium]
MKKFLKIFIPIAIISMILYQYGDSIRTKIETPLDNIFSQINTNISLLSTPCSKPITYKIDSFDTKFGISEKYFLSALSEAENIWEKPFGKELFTYVSDTGDLKINLVYDYRQEATSKLASVGIVVENNKASYDSLKIKFTDLKTQLATAKNSYEKRVIIFNEKQKVYEQQVKYWNEQGGAPKKEYNTLQTDKSILDAEVIQLNNLQTHINEIVDEINALVVVLNRLVNTLNLSVEEYNSINGTLGESFEEGVYQSDGVNKKIDIYEFSNREKLVRVLAHELGHALGLGHVNDPKAIMYKLNQSNNQTLTEADIAELKVNCEIK